METRETYRVQNEAEHQPAPEQPRKRHPVPIKELPTRDRVLLQALLQLAARDLLAFHPSEQVGWMVYFLEQYEAYSLDRYDHPTHALNALDALQKDIKLRLTTHTW